MQTVRKVFVWTMLVLVAFFVVINWPLGNTEQNPIVTFWPTKPGIYYRWPVGLIALVFAMIGFLPTWLYFRTLVWRLTRRIHSLEQSIKITAAAQPPAGQDPETSTEGPHEP